MQIRFNMAGADGHVDVEIAVNANPRELGCRTAARGFPYCTASIHHPARGYTAALGWIQLVRSTDGGSRGASFEMDPFEPLGRTAHPFAFFGFLPTLFDAPSRARLDDLDWTAHSFLCRLGTQPQEVHALLGFSWGFAIRDRAIELRGLESLEADAWDDHRSFLASEHPGWSFAPELG